MWHVWSSFHHCTFLINNSAFKSKDLIMIQATAARYISYRPNNFSHMLYTFNPKQSFLYVDHILRFCAYFYTWLYWVFLTRLRSQSWATINCRCKVLFLPSYIQPDDSWWKATKMYIKLCLTDTIVGFLVLMFIT